MRKYLIIAIFIALFLPFFTKATDYSNDTLLKTDNDVKVYVIFNNQKRWIQNADIFNSYGFKWGDIKTISTSELSTISDNNLIKLTNNSKVYFIENDTKQWIPTADIFEEKGFDWKSIQIVNQQEFDFYKIGNDLTETTDNKKQEFSATTIRIDFSAIVSDGSCLLFSDCSSSKYSIADTNNTPIANLSFNVNPLGWENAKLSKIIFKQVGQFVSDDYGDVQLIRNNKRYQAELSNNTITFIFNPAFDLKSNTSNHFTLTADFYRSTSGKLYQLKLENAEFKGERTNLPVNYDVSNALLPTVVINILKN